MIATRSVIGILSLTQLVADPNLSSSMSSFRLPLGALLLPVLPTTIGWSSRCIHRYSPPNAEMASVAKNEHHHKKLVGIFLE
jgi:hypothetical protein